MRISNRVKRNISLTLSVLGVVCTISRAWDVVIDPHSGKAWFDLFGIIFLTGLCFDDFLMYRRRLAQGLLFGSTADKQ